MRRDDGQSAVELALILPVFLLIVLGVAQFAPAWNKNLTLNAAVRAAARTASTCRFQADPTAATNASFDAVAAPVLSGYSQPTVTYGGTNHDCEQGVSVTVTDNYHLTLSILGITYFNSNLTSTSVSTVE